MPRRYLPFAFQVDHSLSGRIQWFSKFTNVFSLQVFSRLPNMHQLKSAGMQREFISSVYLWSSHPQNNFLATFSATKKAGVCSLSGE